MRKILFAALLIASPVAAQQPFDFSIKNIMRGPELYGRVPQDVRWSADSRWIYFNWVEPGSDWRETPKRYRVRAPVKHAQIQRQHRYNESAKDNPNPKGSSHALRSGEEE